MLRVKTHKKVYISKYVVRVILLFKIKNKNGDRMVECPECGIDNEGDGDSCDDCGAPLDVIECPDCGAMNESDSKFCEKCGTEIEASEDFVEEEEEPAPPVKDKPKPKDKKAPPKVEKKAPKEKPAVEKVVVVKMIFAQNDATKLANKNLKDDGKKLFSKKIEVVEAALLKYLPLIQASFDIEKKKLFGLGGKEKGAESLYFHGMTGKLLQVTDKINFSDITQAKAENIKDFDGIAQFENLPKKMLPKGTERPKIGEKYIQKKLRKLFGATLKKTSMVYLPVFKFKITNTKTKKSRVLYVDSVFGIPTDKNPFN